jgi:hypothetical protein
VWRLGIHSIGIAEFALDSVLSGCNGKVDQAKCPTGRGNRPICVGTVEKISWRKQSHRMVLGKLLVNGTEFAKG